MENMLQQRSRKLSRRSFASSGRWDKLDTEEGAGDLSESWKVDPFSCEPFRAQAESLNVVSCRPSDPNSPQRRCSNDTSTANDTDSLCTEGRDFIINDIDSKSTTGCFCSIYSRSFDQAIHDMDREREHKRTSRDLLANKPWAHSLKRGERGMHVSNAVISHLLSTLLRQNNLKPLRALLDIVHFAAACTEMLMLRHE